MWILQTVHNVCNIYENWVAFIQYGDTTDGTTAVLDEEIITRPLVAVYAVGPLMGTIRLAIADGIMVNRAQTEMMTSDLWLGVEMLDCERMQLGNHYFASNLEYGIFWLVQSALTELTLQN